MTHTSAEENSGSLIRRRILRVAGIILLILLALLGVFLLLGLLPQSSEGLASEPSPVANYAEAVERYKTFEQAESGVVNSAAGSHLLSHGEPTARAYVLVHGITNSPLQWLELGQMLFDRGHNVLILRMPYHGLQSGQVSELKNLKAEDLRAYADDTIDIAAGLGDEIVVAGISGGGTVASWMAANRPEVDRALLVAPFFGIKGAPAFANTLLMNAFSRLPNLNFDSPSEPRREWVYRGEASRGVVAFLSLGNEVVREARDRIVPRGDVLVITTAVDNTANNTATAHVLGLWEEAGTRLETFEFGPEQDIPHNSVDPAADATKKQTVYDKMLNLLGE